VVSAIVEKKVRVPQELKLVLHRNVEAPYMVPFSCDWMEIKVVELAQAMFRVLDRQWRGEDSGPEEVHFRLVKGR
jgi:DNA-binding LacI/PurR family transcriptional regulator